MTNKALNGLGPAYLREAPLPADHSSGTGTQEGPSLPTPNKRKQLAGHSEDSDSLKLALSTPLV